MNNLLESINAFKDKRILVVGDIMLDRWTFGEITRISPEAPVPVLERKGERLTLGGAANVAHNLSSLGAMVDLSGVIGNDRAGHLVEKILRDKRISADAIYIHPTRPTTEKHRILSGEQQLLRLDRENTDTLLENEEDELYARLEPLIYKCSAVILSDYAKGVFSNKFAQKIIEAAKREGVIVLADLKPKNKNYFIGADLISPNLREAQEMTGLERVEDIGPALVREFNAYVVITRGGEGMSAFSKDGANMLHVPGKKIGMFDVSGAGDTVIAVLALGLSAGLTVQNAVVLSNEAGANVVQKPGTAVLSLEELASAFKSGSHINNLSVVPKVWGYEKWIENNEKYCCKILSLNKGYQCSLHYHKNKDETFIVQNGHVRLELADQVLHLRAGAFVRVPPNTPHRFTGIEDSLMIEVSTHHEDADSYRIEESRKVSLAEFDLESSKSLT